MPTPRYLAGEDVINGLLYVVGGYNNSTELATLEVYNPATNTWATKAPMPTPRHQMAVGDIDGLLYVAGGYDNGTVGTLEVYNPATNTWATKSPMPTPTESRGAVVNGILYVIGGNASGYATNVVETYNPATDTWSYKSSMPTPRCHLGVVAFNGLIYAMGGTDTSGDVNYSTMEVYNPALDRWTSAASMPTPRTYLGTAVVNNQVWAIGGQIWTTDTILASADAYDPSTNTWTAQTPMPTARSGPVAAVVNGVLYVVGGANSSGVLATNEAFTPAASPASPTISTTPGGTVELGTGTKLTDSATLTGGANPTGTITFTLTAPNGSTVDTEAATVSGNGTYNTPNGYLPSAAGTYQWVASYGGDSNNNPVATISGAGPEIVNPISPTSPSSGILPTGGMTLSMLRGSAANNEIVATFTDPNGVEPVGNYSATINWGDSSTTTGSISVANGVFTVTGSHAYSQTGSYPVTVTINHGTAPSVTVTSVSNVLDPTGGNLDQNFVTQLYIDLLRRQPDAMGLQAFTSALDQGTSRSQVVNAILLSPEYLALEVQDQYEHFLQRPVDPAGLSAFTALLAAGGTVEQVVVALVSSAEYFQNRGGGTNQGFLNALYLDTLGRPVDATGEAVWLQDLQQGISRAQVAAAILGSQEYQQRSIGSYYQQYLQRNADQGGLNSWVNMLQQGASDNVVISGLLTSQEYYAASHPSTVLPLTPITVPGQFDPSAPTFVIFTNGAGVETRVPAGEVTSSDVDVAVPFLTDPNTFQVQAGTVSIAVQQDESSGTVISLPLMPNLEISAPPATNVDPQTIELATLDEEQSSTTTTVQDYQEIAAASGGNVDVGPLVADLQAMSQQSSLIEQAVQPLVNGSSQQLNLGQFAGTELQLDSATLRLPGSYVVPLLGSGVPQNAEIVPGGGYLSVTDQSGLDISVGEGSANATFPQTPEGAVASTISNAFHNIVAELQRANELGKQSEQVAQVVNQLDEILGTGVIPQTAKAFVGALLGAINSYVPAVTSDLDMAARVFIDGTSPAPADSQPLIDQFERLTSLDKVQEALTKLQEATFTDSYGILNALDKDLQAGIQAAKDASAVVSQWFANYAQIKANLPAPSPPSGTPQTGLSASSLNPFVAIQSDFFDLDAIPNMVSQPLVATNIGSQDLSIAITPSISAIRVTNGDIGLNIPITLPPIWAGIEGGSNTFNVIVFPSGLSVGEHDETLTISNADTGQVLLTVPVTIIIKPLTLPKPISPPSSPPPPSPSSFSNVNAGFTATAYNDLLHRLPSSQETQLWVTPLSSGLSRTQMVQDIEDSGEYDRIIVGVLYNLFLGRDPEAGAVDYWSNFLSSGGTIEQMERGLISSTEFFQVDGGGTEEGFLQALYQDTLGRLPDSAGLADFTQALANGTSPAAIGATILSSQEYLQDEVKNAYLQYLHRAADSTGLNSFVQALQNGAGVAQIIADIMSSGEFFPLPPPPPPPPPTDPFAGSYQGTYTGTAFLDNGLTYAINGPVDFTEANGVITVTVPATGTGTISASGSASFTSAVGIASSGNATVQFGGTFTVTANAVTASGSWSSSFPPSGPIPGGTADGTWYAQLV